MGCPSPSCTVTERVRPEPGLVMVWNISGNWEVGGNCQPVTNDLSPSEEDSLEEYFIAPAKHKNGVVGDQQSDIKQHRSLDQIRSEKSKKIIKFKCHEYHGY